MSNIRIKIGCWRRGVIGIMEFRAAVFPHGLAERAEIGERRNHPRTGLWCFDVRGRDLVGSLEEVFLFHLVLFFFRLQLQPLTFVSTNNVLGRSSIVPYAVSSAAGIFLGKYHSGDKACACDRN